MAQVEEREAGAEECQSVHARFMLPLLSAEDPSPTHQGPHETAISAPRPSPASSVLDACNSHDMETSDGVQNQEISQMIHNIRILQTKTTNDSSFQSTPRKEVRNTSQGERLVEQSQGKYEAVIDFVVKAILVRLSALK